MIKRGIKAMRVETNSKKEQFVAKITAPTAEQICPRCGEQFTGHPAVSRTVEGWKICPKCGAEEAMAAYAAYTATCEKHEELLPLIKDAIATVINTDYDGVYFWELGCDQQNRVWAVVLGWQDYGPSDDDDDDDKYAVGKYHLCIKLAINIDDYQADYNWNWYMPWDEETGDVHDTELAVSDKTLAKDLKWLLEQFYTMYSHDMKVVY